MTRYVTEVRVRNWAELNDALFSNAWNKDLNRFRSHEAFRGLSCLTFDLGTSLTRSDGYYIDRETALIRNFRKYAHRAVSESGSDLYWLAVGQHHGLPTRLLDWTFSPYVAAHFATDNAHHAHQDGIVWCVDYRKALDYLPSALHSAIQTEPGISVFTVPLLEKRAQTLADLERLEEGTEPFLVFFEPPSLDDRIVNQLGLFSMMSRGSSRLDEWLRNRPDVARRVVISAQAKGEIRDKLDEVGVTERVLFPGLDGLATWLKRYYGPPADPKR